MLYIGLLDIYLYMNKLFKFTPKFQFQLFFYSKVKVIILSL